MGYVAFSVSGVDNDPIWMTHFKAIGERRMPVHDWTRVSAGTFHDFHCAWIVELRNVLNQGLLPADYYALAEQDAGDVGPDVLTLKVDASPADGQGHPGGIALADAPPKVRLRAETDVDFYVKKQRRLVIRHASDDRIVALIEIVSPGNKAGKRPFRAFLDKVIAALGGGNHLLLVDLFPATPRDPGGIHGAIWNEIAEEPYLPPVDKALTLAAYAAGHPLRAFVDPVAIGDLLPDMPLFLDPEHYVSVPLEQTYLDAYRGVPRRWRAILEGSGEA